MAFAVGTLLLSVVREGASLQGPHSPENWRQFFCHRNVVILRTSITETSCLLSEPCCASETL